MEANGVLFSWLLGGGLLASFVAALLVSFSELKNGAKRFTRMGKLALACSFVGFLFGTAGSIGSDHLTELASRRQVQAAKAATDSSRKVLSELLHLQGEMKARLSQIQDSVAKGIGVQLAEARRATTRFDDAEIALLLTGIRIRSADAQLDARGREALAHTRSLCRAMSEGMLSGINASCVGPQEQIDPASRIEVRLHFFGRSRNEQCHARSTASVSAIAAGFNQGGRDRWSDSVDVLARFTFAPYELAWTTPADIFSPELFATSGARFFTSDVRFLTDRIRSVVDLQGACLLASLRWLIGSDATEADMLAERVGLYNTNDPYLVLHPHLSLNNTKLRFSAIQLRLRLSGHEFGQLKAEPIKVAASLDADWFRILLPNR